METTMGKKACCQQAENLVLIEKNANLEVWRCSVCNCRHFELSVAAGSLLARAADGQPAPH
jgi:hypothetical protein